MLNENVDINENLWYNYIWVNEDDDESDEE